MIKALFRRKLKRPTAHRISLLRNLATSLIKHEKLITTFPKAKELQGFIEKLVTKAKQKNLTSIREVTKDIRDKEASKKLFDIIAPKYKDTPGGYTKVFRLKRRRGNGAELSLIKFS